MCISIVSGRASVRAEPLVLCVLCLATISLTAHPAHVPVQAANAPSPPSAPVRPVTDIYYGTKVTDPYRYMENLADPEVQSWMKTQNDYTRASNRLRLSIGTLGNGTSGNWGTARKRSSSTASSRCAARKCVLGWKPVGMRAGLSGYSPSCSLNCGSGMQPRSAPNGCANRKPIARMPSCSCDS